MLVSVTVPFRTSDLHMLGFLIRHERNKGLSGGQYYEYELDLDSMIVLETRNEIGQTFDEKHTKSPLQPALDWWFSLPEKAHEIYSP